MSPIKVAESSMPVPTYEACGEPLNLSRDETNSKKCRFRVCPVPKIRTNRERPMPHEFELSVPA